jgi:hypothetical protein
VDQGSRRQEAVEDDHLDDVPKVQVGEGGPVWMAARIDDFAQPQLLDDVHQHGDHPQLADQMAIQLGVKGSCPTRRHGGPLGQLPCRDGTGMTGSPLHFATRPCEPSPSLARGEGREDSL